MYIVDISIGYTLSSISTLYHIETLNYCTVSSGSGSVARSFDQNNISFNGDSVIHGTNHGFLYMHKGQGRVPGDQNMPGA